MHQLTKEQELHDLRVSVFHESGHKFMYRRFGGDGDALIRKNLSGNPDEVSWVGQFLPRRSPNGLYDRNGFRVAELPVNWEVLYGMAGLIAEELLSGDTDDPGLIAESLSYRIWAGDASATDL